MNKKDFGNIMDGLREAAAYSRGEHVPGLRVHIPPEVDVRAIRKALGLTQGAFASRFGFSAAAVKDLGTGSQAAAGGGAGSAHDHRAGARRRAPRPGA